MVLAVGLERQPKEGFVMTYPHEPLYYQVWPEGTELCDQCGQPDNCGDCNHEPLPAADVYKLGGYLRSGLLPHVIERLDNA